MIMSSLMAKFTPMTSDNTRNLDLCEAFNTSDKGRNVDLCKAPRTFDICSVTSRVLRAN
jgi:hypothetical protein